MKEGNNTASGNSGVDSKTPKAGTRRRGRPQKDSEDPAIEANILKINIEGV
jgi:hypothetical protein